MSSWVEHGLDNAKKWARTSSLRRHLGRKRSIHRNTHEAGTVSDGELANGKLSSSSSMLGLDYVSDAGASSSAANRGSTCNSERPVDVGRVGSWAAGFDKLLEDPAGLHTFAEFLKKEFSQENITFWVTCEQYRQIGNKDERKQMAHQIYQNHLCLGALEPVNIDSYARQVAQEGLENPTADLFVPAQKQIFNLMKFDCYQRFLKSQLFKECMMKEMQGQPLPYQGDVDDLKALFGQVGIKDAKASKENDEKRRKSLLPWYKNKGSKDRDSKTKFDERMGDVRKSGRKKKDGKKEETGSDATTGSHSSLAGSDIVGLPRIMNGTSATRESFNSADLTGFPGGQGGAKGGAGCFLCRVVLPDHSTTVVKVHGGETVGAMLHRLLERRGLPYTTADVFLLGSDKPLDPKSEVISLGCKEVRVEQRVIFLMDLPNRKTIGARVGANQTCSDAIKPILIKFGYKVEDVVLLLASSDSPLSLSSSVNAVDKQRIIVQLRKDYEAWCADKSRDIYAVCPRTKCHPSPHLDELTIQILEDLLNGRGQCKFDENGVVNLTGVIKGDQQKNNGLVRRNSLQLDAGGRDSVMRGGTSKAKAIFANRSSSIYETLTNVSAEQPTSDELLEVWNRAQRSRLDDQRGTEINFELPDFLKSSRMDKENRIGSANQFAPFGDDSVYPTPQQAEEYFSFRTSLAGKEDLKDMEIPLALRLHHLGTSSRPVSHPPPRLPPRTRPPARSLPFCPDPLLDIDVTTTGANLDDSLSPSKLPPPPDTSATSLHLEEANFPPPSPLSPSSPSSSSSGRKMSLEPPPLPPKAKLRGPPPRPPSRQQLAGSNPPYCNAGSEDEASSVERFVTEKFNISFV